MSNKINDLKAKLDIVSQDNFNFIGERLKTIREELKKENSAFEKRNVVKITGISSNTLYKIEKGETSSYIYIFKLINLYKIMGYNPLWITTENNIFISKKEENNFDVIYNKTSVSKSSAKLIDDIQNIENAMSKSLKEAIKGFKSSMKI